MEILTTPSTIDMIRLTKKHSLNKIHKFFNDPYHYANIKCYTSTKLSDYFHNAIIETQDNIKHPFDKTKKPLKSFWVGWRHNSEKPNIESKIAIEYNPNKLQNNEMVIKILKEFFKSPTTTIKSIDICKDIYCPIESIFIDQKKKRNIKIFDTPKGKTMYIGTGDGRVKVYDKAKEEGSFKPKTRYEISLNIDLKLNMIEDLHLDLKKAPEILIPQHQMFIQPISKAIIYALQNNIIKISDLTKNELHEHYQVLEEYQKMSITSYEVYQLLTEYADYILKTNLEEDILKWQEY